MFYNTAAPGPVLYYILSHDITQPKVFVSRSVWAMPPHSLIRVVAVHSVDNLGPKLSSSGRRRTCGDPESFVRVGPTWTRVILVDEGERGTNCQYKRAIIDPPVKYQAGVPMMTLGSFVIFQGIRTSIPEKPYIFVICQGGPDPLPPPPLDPRMKALIRLS